MWPFFHKMSKVLLNKRKRSGQSRMDNPQTQATFGRTTQDDSKHPTPSKNKQRKHTRQKSKTMDTIDPLKTRRRNPGTHEELRQAN